LPPIVWLAQALAQTPSVPSELWSLDNGLRVVLAPDPTVPLVAVDLWYGVGSRDEEPGRTGFAHLFEHLMFQGSPAQPDEFFVPLEQVGAQINGTTNVDRTNYFEVLPRENLPLALFLEADRMQGLLEVLDQGKLDNQREVVRNERRQRIENPPYGDVRLMLARQLYPPGHGYHHPTIGSHRDLEAASLQDVQDFFGRWYTPSRAVLVIAGDFESVTARELVQRWFGPIGQPSAPLLPSPPPPWPGLTSSVTVIERRDVPLERVWMAWHTPAGATQQDTELDVLAELLAGGRDGRLVRALVEEQRLAQEVTASQGSSEWSSTFVISATAAPGRHTDEIVAAIDSVLASVLSDAAPPTASEVATAAAAHEWRVRSSLETVLGRAETVQRCMRSTGEPDCAAEEIERMQTATPASVLSAGQSWLLAPRVALHVLPAAPAPEVASAEGGAP
jgi:zinc protease